MSSSISASRLDGTVKFIPKSKALRRRQMTNDEWRMANEWQSSDDEAPIGVALFEIWKFGILSSFDIRALSFPIGHILPSRNRATPKSPPHRSPCGLAAARAECSGSQKTARGFSAGAEFRR